MLYPLKGFRCHLCGGIVEIAACVLWCDDCIDEYLTTDHGLTMDQFIARKQAARQDNPA